VESFKNLLVTNHKARKAEIYKKAFLYSVDSIHVFTNYGPQLSDEDIMRKTILHVFILGKKSLNLLFPESAGKLGKTILNVFFNKDKIMNKSPKDLLHQMSSNLLKNFLFKCRSEFHISCYGPNR
jgi:hypothetical protein